MNHNFDGFKFIFIDRNSNDSTLRYTACEEVEEDYHSPGVSETDSGKHQSILVLCQCYGAHVLQLHNTSN